MNPEELDEARAREAFRLCSEDPNISIVATAARLARENWTPPEPEPVVDPDLMAFREWAARRSEANGSTDWASAYRQGRFDHTDKAYAYRAGAAGSAERIKELEARVAELKAALKPLSECEIPEESDSLPDGYGCRYYVTFGEIRTARALLKGPDQ